MKIIPVIHALLLSLLVLFGASTPHRFLVAQSGIFPSPSSEQSLGPQIANFSVINLNDSGPGSLRQAITDANANPGGDVITFSVTGTITLLTGELPITDGLTILGPGATELTISGNNIFRVFNITGIDAIISGLTISNGNVGAGAGGGIRKKAAR